MLRVESALARALARAEVIPTAAADAIAAACRVELYDPDAIFAETATAGTPVIPLVRMLTERVDAHARGYVHWGATSQDVVDTAMVLQMRDGLELLVRELHGVADGAATLAERHRHTVMAGRTLLQHAAPITFGLKAARWLALTVRQMRALDALRSSALADCSSAAPSAPSPRSATRAPRSRHVARRGAHAARSPICPGTPSAIASRPSRRRSASPPAR